MFGSDDGRVHALTRNGAPIWTHTLPGAAGVASPVSSSPAVLYDAISRVNRVYVTNENGGVYALFETSPVQVRTQWQYDTSSSRLRTSPGLSEAGHRLYVATSDGFLHCLNALTGALVVRRDLRPGPLTAPMTSGARVHVSNEQGRLFAFDAECNPAWTLNLPSGPIRVAAAAGWTNSLRVIAGNVLHSVSMAGAIEWSEPISQPVTSAAPIVDGTGTTIVASDDGRVLAFSDQMNASGGRPLWTVRLNPGGGPQLSTPALDPGGRVYVGAGDGNLYVLADAPAAQIAYHGDSVAKPDIFSLREVYGRVDPRRAQRLVGGRERDIQPAYSLDRTVMAFVSNRDGSNDVFIATAGGRAERNLTQFTILPPRFFLRGSSETEPAFTPVSARTGQALTPDGKQYLALTSDANPQGLRRLVFVGGSNLMVRTSTFHRFPDWARLQGIPEPIRATLESDNSEQSQIAFSPNGRYLAYRSCSRNPSRARLYLLTIDGPSSRRVALVDTPVEGFADCEEFAPTFAPDSRWLAARVQGGLNVYDLMALVAPAYLPAFSTPPPATMTIAHPSWSPDGSEIAVALNGTGTRDLYVANGLSYRTFDPLFTRVGERDEPSFYYFKFSPPVLSGVAIQPVEQYPGDRVEIFARGLDILQPENNWVFFTDANGGTRRQATVVSTRVDARRGLGAVTVVVPDLAGNGPITVETRFGSASCCSFRVLPKPDAVRHSRSVPGARVRIIGRGFDLRPPTQNTVEFTASEGGWVAASIVDSRVDEAAGREILVVEVPQGVANQRPVKVTVAGGVSAECCTFTILRPTVAISRTSGLTSQRREGSDGSQVLISGREFPYDAEFGYGTSNAVVTYPGASSATHTTQFAPPTFGAADVTTLAPLTIGFPALNAGHSGGEITVRATDAGLISSIGEGQFRTPLRNIPIIFVPGTSAVSLDVVSPLSPYTQITDIHWFPWLCKLCPEGRADHPGWIYSVTGAGDPAGPRAWMGPEAVAYIGSQTLLYNQGNHYLDVLGFGEDGRSPAQLLWPGGSVAVGTVAGEFYLTPIPNNLTTYTIYRPLIDFITNPASGAMNRPLCSNVTAGGGATGTGPCQMQLGGQPAGPPVSGATGLYLFPYDWRRDMESEAARLDAYIQSILSRPDVVSAGVTRVALITHSYGGPVARTYYRTYPNHRVDQMISVAGGFLGVPLPVKVLMMGDTWGTGLSFDSDTWGAVLSFDTSDVLDGVLEPGALTAGIAEWETESLAQNWPTAYAQAPNSQDWFHDHGTRQGGQIGGRTVDRRYIIDDRWDGPWLGRPVDPTNADHMDWLASNHNRTIVDRTRLQNRSFGTPSLGDFRSGTIGADNQGVFHHRIISRGRMDTVQGGRLYTAPSWYGVARGIGSAILGFFSGAPLLELIPVTHREPLLGDGDGTVPYHGLLGRLDPADDRVYVIDGEKHLPLAQRNDVHVLIRDMLDGRLSNQAQAPSQFQSPANVPELLSPRLTVLSAAEGNGSASESSEEVRHLAAANSLPVAADELDPWLIRVSGAVEMEIEDQAGRRLGKSRDREKPGLIEQTIAGGSFNPGSEFTSALLSKEGVYQLVFTGRIPSIFNLRITQYSGREELGTVLFLAIPTGPGISSRLTFDTRRSLTSLIVAVTDPRSGQTIEHRPMVLGPKENNDRVNPKSSIVLRGGSAVVAAKDEGGAGLLRTYYTTDGEKFSEYKQPFNVTDTAKVVMAFSMDRNGNLEYPGATMPVLSTQPGEFAVTARVARVAELPPVVLKVLNPDPIQVTQPITWKAESDAPWLKLDKTTGKTPDEIRAVILSNRLVANGPVVPGRYRATIRVQATTPNVVFPERRVPVSLEVLR